MDAAVPERGPVGPTPAGPTTYRLEFSASGSEYFRIWIVNLLLTVVTLGLYYPWAKVRRLRYFYGNTRLAGHAFDFHGDPKRMLRGYLQVGVLFLLYALAGHVSAVAGLVALALMALVWPAVQVGALRFRLAQTSWRGMRFRFTGGIAGAYRALLPGLVAVAAMILASATAHAAAHMPSGFVFLAVCACVAATLALAPLALWRFKCFQHDNFQFATAHTRLTAGPRPFYQVLYKAVCLSAAIFVAATAAVVLVVATARGMGSTYRIVMFALLILVLYGSMLLALRPYLTARLQNLVWSHTASPTLLFASELDLGSLVRLTAANYLRVIVTLGVYWPFALVANARLRLQALSVQVNGDLDALIAQEGAERRGASGDAAADLLGFDLGL